MWRCACEWVGEIGELREYAAKINKLYHESGECVCWWVCVCGCVCGCVCVCVSVCMGVQADGRVHERACMCECAWG